MILGIISVGSHDTFGSGGHRRGYLLGVVDMSGNKYFVDIPERTYADLIGIVSVGVQKFQGVSMDSVVKPQEAEIGSSPTGTAEEVEQMQKLLEQAKNVQVADPGDVMKKLGFVSDDNMKQPQQLTQDPVDEVLAMASSLDEDEEYEDPGEESFSEEDVEGI